MPGQIPEEVKAERRHLAMELQRSISREINRSLVGQVFPMIVDGPSEESDLVLVARGERQAPDIDGVTYIANKPVRPGEIVPVRVLEGHDYDLVGEVVE